MQFSSTSLVSLSLDGCRAITSLELKCPHLEKVSLDGCDHLERAEFCPVSETGYQLLCFYLDFLTPFICFVCLFIFIYTLFFSVPFFELLVLNENRNKKIGREFYPTRHVVSKA